MRPVSLLGTGLLGYRATADESSQTEWETLRMDGRRMNLGREDGKAEKVLTKSTVIIIITVQG